MTFGKYFPISYKINIQICDATYLICCVLVNVCLICVLKFRRILNISFAGKIFSKKTFLLLLFWLGGWGVQGVPVKKKLSVSFQNQVRITIYLVGFLCQLEFWNFDYVEQTWICNFECFVINLTEKQLKFFWENICFSEKTQGFWGKTLRFWVRNLTDSGHIQLYGVIISPVIVWFSKICQKP